jgi:hypothetical protein
VSSHKTHIFCSWPDLPSLLHPLPRGLFAALGESMTDFHSQHLRREGASPGKPLSKAGTLPILAPRISRI